MGLWVLVCATILLEWLGISLQVVDTNTSPGVRTHLILELEGIDGVWITHQASQDDLPFPHGNHVSGAHSFHPEISVKRRLDLVGLVSADELCPTQIHPREVGQIHSSAGGKLPNVLMGQHIRLGAVKIEPS